MLLASPMRPILVLSIAALGACTSQPLGARLAECELITDGEIGPGIEQTFYAPDDCYQDCLASATCEELRATLCRTSLDLRVRCDQRCAYHCSDGALVPVDAQCDGFPQCAGGEDEAGCPTFRCNDGRELTIFVQCNGWSECGTGEDEEGCFSGATCQSIWGVAIPIASYACNGNTECVDGSDESGCPTYRCANGTTFTYSTSSISPRCDGWARCGDGSDERGCAALQPMCPG